LWRVSGYPSAGYWWLEDCRRLLKVAVQGSGYRGPHWLNLSSVLWYDHGRKFLKIGTIVLRSVWLSHCLTSLYKHGTVRGCPGYGDSSEVFSLPLPKQSKRTRSSARPEAYVQHARKNDKWTARSFSKNAAAVLRHRQNDINFQPKAC
jgi:hypothetical protein